LALLRIPRRWLVAGGVVVIGMVALGLFLIRSNSSACTASTCDAAGLPLGPVSASAIQSHEEAHLSYPGSSIVSSFGSAERSFAGGQKNSAFSGAIFSTSDAPQDVYRWYRDWLLAHRWAPYEMSRLSSEISVEGYARGQRERFDVAIEDPVALGKTLGRSLPSNTTVFEARYIIFPASDVTPTATP
jgi:hypothetical protein